MNLPSTLTHQGYIGIRDFRGDLIRAFSDNQWIYHSEVCIWKDPVIAMQRTKAIGLLHKQVCKDSSISRQGIPDYLVTMRKPGNNEEPVSGKLEYFAGENPPNRSGDSTRDSINIWQRYASPVWMDINPTRTLQYTTAKDKNDERHICPLQLDVIERGIQLWTNPGETVLDPFNGIGSTGHVALSRNRKYVGVELKDTYYAIAKQNMYDVSSVAQQSLF
jgi:DNA modification methylase